MMMKSVFRPVPRSLHGLLPAAHERLPGFGRHLRDERAIERPMPGQVGQIVPHAGGQPRKVGRPERRGFRDHRPADLDAQQIGLKLH